MSLRFAFFGTPEIARTVLEELQTSGYLPALVVTNPDAPIGRKQTLTAPPVKEWALANHIPVIQPTSLKGPAAVPELSDGTYDIFIVAAYGKLIPQWLLDIPEHGTLNVHPSLLPKFRGASPIRSAILADERTTGVTIMLMDAEMDHGPVLSQEPATISPAEWPVPGRTLDERLAKQGGRLLTTTIPGFLAGTIVPREQDHDAATFCTKISKAMSELVLDPHHLPTGQIAHEYLRKVRAFDGWPETFFVHNGMRVKIKDAALLDGVFTPTRVVLEGKREQSFTDYLHT